MRVMTFFWSAAVALSLWDLLALTAIWAIRSPSSLLPGLHGPAGRDRGDPPAPDEAARHGLAAVVVLARVLPSTGCP
ncbi:hypothetical protein [Nonomuraea solani]|uniref:hypothetical protein n=1 Tax=Nonomuraea solani TaxID=1144553 RepID=UPI0011B027B2|nr:hypothetical protein [Nonomuraea solani]